MFCSLHTLRWTNIAFAKIIMLMLIGKNIEVNRQFSIADCEFSAAMEGIESPVSFNPNPVASTIQRWIVDTIQWMVATSISW